MGISQTPQAIVPASLTSGSITLLSTTALSGATTTVSNIPQSYKDLKILIINTVVSGARLKFRPNGSSTVSYSTMGYASNIVSNFSDGATIGTDTTNPTGFLYIYDYANTTYNKMGYLMTTSSNQAYSIGSFSYNSTSAITSIGIHFNGNSPTGGSVLIYGVN